MVRCAVKKKYVRVAGMIQPRQSSVAATAVNKKHTGAWLSTPGRYFDADTVDAEVTRIVELPIGHPDRCFLATRFIVKLRRLHFDNDAGSVANFVFQAQPNMFYIRLRTLKNAIKALRTVQQQESERLPIKQLELIG